MKKILLTGQIGVLTLFVFTQRVMGQCSADYSTTNNFCDLDSLYLTVFPTGGTEPYTFLWETGETTQTISIPHEFGDYLVTITDANGECSFVINCHIKPNWQVLGYPFNQNACEGDTVTLFLDWFRDSIPGATYLWSTGETTSTIQITDDIVWSATVTDPSTGCEFIIPPNLFDFHPTPYPEIVGPDMICAGQSITLTATGGPFGLVVWYPGGVWSETLEVIEPGTYIVWASSTEVNYCWHQDTVTIVQGDINPPVLAGPPGLCTGQSGTIEITNSSEYAEFAWSNGQSTSSISVNQAGTYVVTVTNSGGCTSTGSLTIEDGSDYDVTASADASTCGESNGSIDLNVSPPGSYTFNWSNGSNDEDLAGVLSGNYTVTVTSEGGCTATITAFVPDNPVLITINEVITHNTSCDAGNGAIDISLQPSGIYTYLWSNGATTEDIGNVSPGTYSVTVTLGANCTATEIYVVENNTNVPDVIGLEVAATCGQSNGSIDLIVNGGEGPFTFIWSNGATSEDLNDIPADNYSVTVTGANGCAETETVIVPDDAIVITLTADVIPVTSCIESNGSIDLTVSPPGVYTFIWSNGATTEDINNLPEGIFSVEVLFGENCTETATYTITHDGNQVDVSAITTPNNSCGLPNGSIDLTVSPEDIYSYQWSNGASTEDLQDLGGGIYSVTITDSENCSSFGTYTIESFVTVPVIIPTITSASCGQSNGIIDLIVTPPEGNNYIWSNGAVTEDISGVLPGTYNVTVTGANGCIVSDTFEVQNINSSFSLSALSVPDSSCIIPNGSIDLTVSPAGSYTFLWSSGAITEDLQGLDTGNYTVTVTDGAGCATTSIIAVTSGTTNPTITSQITPATCGQNTGAIDLTVQPAGGNTFTWSHGSGLEDVADIAPGIYVVTVTGSNGCTAVDTFEVLNINANFTLSAILSENNSCVNPNGSIDLTLTPSGTYSFSWSNGMTTEDIQNLNAGNYTVTVTDSMSCATTQTFIIAGNTAGPVISAVTTQATCGQNTGAIDISVFPSGNNTFLWSNGLTSEDVLNLAAGIYTVTVTGANGCPSTASFDIQNTSSNFSLTASVIHDNSCISENGALDLSVTPIGTYLFLWSNGSTSEDLQGLSAGSYSVTVTDSLNCTTTESFLIESQTVFPALTELITPASCGQDNGAIDLSVTPSPGNSFVWSNGFTGEDLQSLSPGNYSVTVTSANGCTATAAFNVQNTGSQFSISAIASVNNSCVNPNGAIDLTISPSGIYSFNWSNGATTEDLQNLVSGIYSVTVTDDANCSTSESVTIDDQTSNPLVTHTLTPETCGESNGSIDLSVTPSAGNTYAWSNGETQEDLHNLAPGIYSVTVTNAQGCTWSDAFTLSGSVMPDVDLGADLIVEYGQAVTLRAVISVPVSALDTVIWLPGEFFSCSEPICLEQTFIPTEQMEVVLMVFDTNGCMVEESIMVNIRSVINPAVFIPNVFSPNADGANDIFTIFANPDVEEVVDLRIFDRWGDFVFQNQHFPPNNFEYGWDGSFHAKMMDPQVFVYWTIVKFKDGAEQLYKGDVTLVR